ncbi:hypothetical protein [Polaribacter gochangensis]|uniref:hypothetical protein n=1 Tax=Polaribacter gochangensis TaxID=3252903 RepID=UPI0039046767
MKKLVTVFAGILLAFNVNSQTTLSAGDIAILQYNADGSPEVIKFLALKSMEAGTTINFTDNGWRSNNTFRSNEGIDVWTAPSNITCGTIITFTLTNIALGTNGDQILAYQGSSGSPTFIFAINNQGAAVWQTTANNASNSALPTGLTNGVNAIAISEIDNAKYDSSTLVGTKAAILSAICNNANWGGSNSVNQTFGNTFTSETTWTTSWSNPNPEDYFKAIIDGDYNTSDDGDFSACELQINSLKTLTVNSGGIVSIENGISVSGNIVIEDNGSLVQTTKDGPNTGTGYSVNRISTSQDEEGNYTYWSSPLTSSTLAEVANTQRYYSFTASSQAWVAGTSSTSMTPGFGYITTGDSGITYPNTYTANFTGSAFNNGDISVTLGFTADADPETDWNLLGNPYPSAIDADAFIADNTTIGGTLYFWTHNTLDSAGNNTQDDYVLWNGSGGIGSCTGCTAPDGNIASGQGFFAQALSTGTATFTNSMRVSGSNTLFYKGVKKEKDRIWLNLTAENSFSQILIGFFKKATDGVDRIYDGLRLNGGASINFYSILEDNHYGIQGKSSLKESEEIQLGFNSTKTGEFKIGIEKIEGLLKKSKIVLLDKELNKRHNLKKDPYPFNVDVAGTYNDRFELLINPKKIEVIDPSNKIANIYLKRNTLHIKSKIKIKNVKVLNLYGQKLFNKKVNRKALNINLKRIKSTNIYIVKVLLENGKIITKKVVQ